jgi:hypothetical protein
VTAAKAQVLKGTGQLTWRKGVGKAAYACAGATPADGITGLLGVFGSSLRILAVSDHEDERGGHGRSASWGAK